MHLPWDGNELQKEEIKKGVFKIHENIDALLASEEELEYEFEFNMDHNVVIA